MTAPAAPRPKLTLAETSPFKGTGPSSPGSSAEKLVRALLVFALLAVPAPALAQRIDPDWRILSHDSREHFLAGGGISAAARLILPKAHGWQRLAVCGTIAAAYEFGQSSATERTGRGYGWGPKDWLLTVAGCSLVELVLR